MTSLDRLEPQTSRLHSGSQMQPANVMQDYEEGMNSAEELETSYENGDDATAAAAYDDQRKLAGMATLQVAARGGDPRYETAPIGAFVDPSIEVERRFIAQQKVQRELDGALAQNGFHDVQKFMTEVADSYRKKNESLLIKQPKNEQEFLEQVQQMQQVIVDPNRLAAVRQTVVKLDQIIKQIDPKSSFFTNPKTKKWGEWLNREAGGGGVGYFSAGEQKLELGAAGNVAQFAVEGIEGLSDFGTSAVHGAWTLADRASRALGGPGFAPATNFIETADGQVVADSSKAPGIMEALTMLYAQATDRNMEEAVATYRGAREMEASQRNNMQAIAFGASRVIGMGFGYGLPAGVAMNAGSKAFGSMMQGGLKALAVESAQVAKIAGVLARTAGAAAGNGAAEALAYGNQEGYGKAFAHGMAVAPALMALGWMGKRTENWLKRKNMPGRMAAAISGAVEGVGFGALEKGEIGGIWNFLKDPNEDTFATYMKNVVGMMLFKGAFHNVAKSPGERAIGAVAPETMAQVNHGRAREEFSSRVAQGKATPEQMAQAPTKDVGALKELGEVSQTMRQAASPAELATSRSRKAEIEQKLDIEEMKLGDKSKEEMAKLEDESGPIGPEQAKLPTREDIAEVAAMPTGHEKNVRLIAMMKSAQLGMREAATKYVAADSAREMEVAKEQYDTQQTVRKMMTGKAGPKFESLVDEVMTKKESAQKEVASQKRVFQEEKLADLDKQRKKLERKVREKTPLGGVKVESEMTPAELAFRNKERTEESVTAKQREGSSKELDAINQEIRQLRKELGVAGAESEQQISATGEATPKMLEERGPRTTTPEMLERYGRTEKAAALREKLQAEQKPYEKPTEGHISSEKAGVLMQKGGPERRPEGHPHAEEGADEGRLNYRNLPIGDRPGADSMKFPPTRQLEATPGVAQMRASDIIAEMQGRPGREGFRIPLTSIRVGGEAPDPVRVAMRTGRIPAQSKAYGYFKLFENLTRTQEGNDLVVGAHEWSHAMLRHALSDRGGLEHAKDIAAWEARLSPEQRNEFQTVLANYPGQQKLPKWQRATEAWAEWHARNLLGDESLHASTPHLTPVMQRFLAAPGNAPLRKQYQRIQDMLHRYQAQGALGRLRQSRIGPTDVPTETERKTKPTKLQVATDAVGKQFADDIIQLKRAQTDWLKASGREAPKNITEDPARMFDALRMTAGKTVGHWIQKGIKSPAGDVPSLKSIIKRVGGKVEDFTDYLVAVRNATRLKQGKKAQQPLRDYAYAINLLQRANPEFRETARELKKWTDAVVDYIADAGTISRESAQRIKDSDVVYLPFFRAIEGPRASQGGRGVGEKGSGIQRFHGSGFEVKDPLGAIQDVALNLVSKAHQHMVMNALYKMALANEAGGLATVVQRDVVPSEHPVKRVIDALQKKLTTPPEGMWEETFAGVFDILRDANALDPQTITLFSQKSFTTGTRSIIAFTPRLTPEEIKSISMDKLHKKIIEGDNDRLQWLEVDTRAYETLMGVDKSPTFGWLDVPVLKQILTFPARATRLFATGISPGFTVANVGRDILSYSVFNQRGKFSPLSGLAQWVRGAALYLDKNGPTRELYDAAGIRTSSFYSEGQRRDLLRQHRTVMQKTAHALSTALDKFKSFFEAPENFLRIAEFKKVYDDAKASGASEIEARMRAVEAGREITVNFARAGMLARAMNQVIPYFNPALQGLRKTWRQLARGGDGKNDVERARIQRAAFANGIAAITVPSMFLWWLNHDEEWYQDLPQWRKSIYFNMKIGDSIISIPKPFELGVIFGSAPEAAADSMYADGNPVDIGTLMKDSLLSYLDGPAALLPAFLRPLIEGQFNYSGFYDRQLTPEWIKKGRVPEEQATFYTTEIAKILSAAIGGKITPIEIEHYLGGYSAGASTSAMRIADEVLGLKDHPGLQANPLVRFTKQEVHGQSRFVDDLYELSTRLEQREGSDKITVPETQLKTDVDAATRQISALRKAHQQGRISREEANRRSYEIAKPLVERGER